MLNVFRRSAVPQKQLIIHHHHHEDSSLGHV